jgi:hypothetical protein
MPIAVHINLAEPEALLAWAAIVAGLALLLVLIALAGRHSGRSRAVQPGARQQPGRCPRHDWERVAGIARAGLSQAETAILLHARAADRVDAAEYAFGRLLAECAAVTDVPATARWQPVPLPPRAEAPYAEAPALAA